MFGYYRLASAVPQLRVADVDYNVDQLMDGFRKAAEQKAAYEAILALKNNH